VCGRLCTAAPIDDDPTTSRRGLAPLGGMLKRRRLANAAAYAEDEPHVTDSALDSLFEALYAYITPTWRRGRRRRRRRRRRRPALLAHERAGTSAVMGAEDLARAVAAAVCSTGAAPGARPMRDRAAGYRRVTTIGRAWGRGGEPTAKRDPSRGCSPVGVRFLIVIDV
jgi:hypothetical protein